MELRYPMRHVPVWSVIRLDDGRIGFKGRYPGEQQVVIFADGTGEELTINTQVEIIKYPANLAMEYVAAEYVKQVSNK